MIAQPPDKEESRLCGAIVKYNPCTEYARGSQCSYFDIWTKKCDRPPLTCEMPEYDKWYKDVLKGERKYFYPNRIRLLENPGVPMFLFHTHHRAIMGEAQIVRSTTENGRHIYWFDKFLAYHHPVQLELLETDPRLPKARKGRWLCIYIRRETIEEIRSLSKLAESKRKKLGKDLQSVIEQMKKSSPPNEAHKPIWKFDLRSECNKLKRNFRIDEKTLVETKNYFSKSSKRKLHVGRSPYESFYASLYLAFRMLEIPKLLNDISRMSGVPLKRLAKLYRLLVRGLNLTVPPLDPEQLTKTLSDRLDVSEKTIRKAVFYVRKARKRRIDIGKAPSSIAAVATFIACQKEGETKNKKQIAEAFGVSRVTIRNYSRNLEALFVGAESSAHEE